MASEQCQDNVIRRLEIIGEASKRLSEEIRNKYADVPWRDIAGLRDVLIHDYMGVDLVRVWEITQENLGGMKKRIVAILQDLESGTT